MKPEGLGLWTPKVTTWLLSDQHGLIGEIEADYFTVDGGALVFRKQDGSPILAYAPGTWHYVESSGGDE